MSRIRTMNKRRARATLRQVSYHHIIWRLDHNHKAMKALNGQGWAPKQAIMRAQKRYGFLVY